MFVVRDHAIDTANEKVILLELTRMTSRKPGQVLHNVPRKLL